MHRYNKLLLYLDELTSEAQCAFYLGRLITDNAIIKFDFPHKIQQSRHPWDTHCAYRLDLAEAYADIDRSPVVHRLPLTEVNQMYATNRVYFFVLPLI